jgi:hypothetical protein
VPSSIAEAVAEAKTGIWQRLVTTGGLTESDGVRVVSAVVSPDELAPGTDVVELGDVTIATPARPGLAGRAAAPTLNGFLTVTRLEGDEPSIQAIRARAAALMGLVETTLAADETVDGTVAGPGGLTVNVSALTESPVDYKGQAARRATIPFAISWTSHSVT